MLANYIIVATPSSNTVQQAWRFVRFVDVTGETILHTTPDNCATIDIGDVNNPEHIMCHQCRLIKPSSDFKRKATRAQALAWGYSGRVRLEYVGKSCKSCYTPPKPLSQLTPLQIKHRLSAGNHEGSEGRAKAILENRIKRGKQGIAQGVKNREGRLTQESWNPLLIAVKEASRRFARQLADIKAKDSLRERSSPSSPHAMRMAYTRLILDTARLKAKDMQHHIKQRFKKPESIKRWQDLITDVERTNIQAHFNAIPPEEAKHMKQAAVLSYFKY